MPGKLHLAAADASDDYKQVKLLVEQKKIDPNLTDENDLSPLEYAIKGNNFKIIKYLVETVRLL